MNIPKPIASPPEKMTRRERNKLRTRRAILTAAREGFGRAGIYATTMDEIAEAAEISRATLFNYFASKNEIVDEIVRQMDDNFMGVVDHFCSTLTTPEERLKAVFTHSADGLAKLGHGAKHLVGYSELGIHESNGANRMARLRAAFAHILDYDLRDSAETLDHPVIEASCAIYVGIIHNWRISDDYDLKRHLDRTAPLILDLNARRY